MTNPLYPFSRSEGVQKQFEQAAFMDDTEEMVLQRAVAENTLEDSPLEAATQLGVAENLKLIPTTKKKSRTGAAVLAGTSVFLICCGFLRCGLLLIGAAGLIVATIWQKKGKNYAKRS